MSDAAVARWELVALLHCDGYANAGCAAEGRRVPCELENKLHPTPTVETPETENAEGAAC